jgi:hypothetical protein
VRLRRSIFLVLIEFVAGEEGGHGDRSFIWKATIS